jgi:hypothetical protein
VVTAGINSLAENDKVRLPADLAKPDAGQPAQRQ